MAASPVSASVDSTRERVLAAAADLTAEAGWSAVTMSAIGDRIGVSRQTVYNEVGSKPALAEAMVLREVALFLDGVEQAFAAHPQELYSAIQEAALSILERAQTSALLGAVVSAEYGAVSDLLPLITTRNTALVEMAKALVSDFLLRYDGIEADDPALPYIMDTIIRVVLSHVMQPGGTPSEVAQHLAWLVVRLVDAAWHEIPQTPSA